MANNYNLIAPIYDLLKKVIFGDSLIETECHFLKDFDLEKSLLVIGSGSSQFLENIDLSHFSTITCLDKSAKMCTLSRKRIQKLDASDKIKVEQSEFQLFASDQKYDIIAIPFFLDCQTDKAIQEMLEKVHFMLKKHGYLIITDFNPKPKAVSKQLLIRLMYLFFKISTNISRNTLPDFNSLFNSKNWILENRYIHGSGLLFSLKLKNT